MLVKLLILATVFTRLPPGPVGAVSNRTESAQLQTAPTIHEERKRLSESLQSPEIQKRLSEARRGNTNRQGKTGQKHTDEWCKNHSARIKSRKQKPEHIEKRVNSRKGYTPTPETREKIGKAKRGKKRSPEHRAKISKAQKGKRKRKKSSSLQT